MDQYSPNPVQGGHASLITYVKDRPGHDARYAINATKLETELGWSVEENFESGIEKTVRWYLENPSWWHPMVDGSCSGS